jgi:plastocyanin
MLATVDPTLSGEPIGDFAMGHDQMSSGRAKAALVLAANQVGIDNFSFTPPVLTVKPGTEVTWINNDDVPHVIVNSKLKFPPSKVLDTGQRYSHTFAQPGTYDYYCSIHPKMTGKVIVA